MNRRLLRRADDTRIRRPPWAQISRQNALEFVPGDRLVLGATGVPAEGVTTSQLV